MTFDSGTEPASGYAADGNTVVMCAATAQWADDAMRGILAQHKQTGAHGDITTDSVTNAGNYTQSAGTFSVPAGSINWAALPTGAQVQQVATTYAAVATGTTLIPNDDTIPQNTEGDEYMSQAITPKATTHRLKIDVTILVANSAAQDFAVALFQDSTANALAATGQIIVTTGALYTIKLTYEMAAGTTSATTFKVRAGGNGAGTTTFNGTAGARKYGAIAKSSIVITETKA